MPNDVNAPEPTFSKELLDAFIKNVQQVRLDMMCADNDPLTPESEQHVLAAMCPLEQAKCELRLASYCLMQKR